MAGTGRPGPVRSFYYISDVDPPARPSSSLRQPPRSSVMRVMYLVKSNHPGPPSPELGAAIGKLTEREVKAGRLLDQGGLMPISTGAEISIADGKLSLTDG